MDVHWLISIHRNQPETLMYISNSGRQERNKYGIKYCYSSWMYIG